MLTVRLCHFWVSSGLHKEENLQKYTFSDFSWAGNFAFGIAAAALDGFCLVPCTRDIRKFLTVLQWVLSTELKLLDSSNDSWISAFNGGKMYPSHFWWSEQKLEGSSTRKKTPNQQSILLNSTISRPVSHLEALSHDFKVSICWSLQHLTDPPCRTPQHSAEGRAEQELWGGWHYMTEHGIWHSSAPSVSQRHPRFLLESMLPLTDSALQLLPAGMYHRSWHYRREILKRYFLRSLSLPAPREEHEAKSNKALIHC